MNVRAFALLGICWLTQWVYAAPIPLGAQMELEHHYLFPGMNMNGIAWHQNQVWTVDQAGDVRLLDPTTGNLTPVMSTGLITHNGLGSDGSSLYMTYDPGGNTLFKSIVPDGVSQSTPTLGARDMTAEGGGLWYADFDTGEIVKMDAGGSLLASHPAPGGFGAAGIEWDGAHLLFTHHDGNTLFQINPNDGAVVGQIDLSSFNPTIAGGLAWDGSHLYAADGDDIYIMRVRAVPETFGGWYSLAPLVIAIGLFEAKRRLS